MFHEYGHLRAGENRKGVASVSTTIELHKRPEVQAEMSGYGKSDPKEGEAEAYMEWHLTKGTTGNRAAKAYAQAFEWDYQ